MLRPSFSIHNVVAAAYGLPRNSTIPILSPTLCQPTSRRRNRQLSSFPILLSLFPHSLHLSIDTPLMVIKSKQCIFGVPKFGMSVGMSQACLRNRCLPFSRLSLLQTSCSCLVCAMARRPLVTYVTIYFHRLWSSSKATCTLKRKTSWTRLRKAWNRLLEVR